METTAGSRPPQTVKLGGAKQAAADESLAHDLVGRTRAVRAGQLAHDHRARADLEALARIVVPRLQAGSLGAEIDRARLRASKLAAADGAVSTAVALAFASDVFALCAVERRSSRPDAERLVAKLAALLGLSKASVALHLFLGAVGARQLLDLPPAVALKAQLRLLVALTPVVEGSLWTKGLDGRPVCLLQAGTTTQTRRFRAVAARALEGKIADSGTRGAILGVPVLRWETPWAALVVRTRLDSRDTAVAYVAEAASAMSPVIQREFVLRRSAARERSLVSASERRLGRLAFDLHDGALQHVAALGADLFLFRRQLTDGLPEPSHSVAASRVDDLQARIRELDRVLRELAHSLEPVSLVRRPLARVIADEVASFTERTAIDVQQRVVGDFSSLTVSQKIALVRVVQEALTNIREHANASLVRISIADRNGSVDAQVEDDGVGFHVARTLLECARRGRFGLVGSSERVRLLGGTFDVQSRPGGPTTVSLSLPRWRPLGVEQSRDDGFVPALAVD